MTTELDTQAKPKTLVEKFANKYTIDPAKLLTTLKATAFKQRDGTPEVTNEQMAALLIVADQYGLNPFTKEIFAFPDKQNGIVPVVGVDGWSRLINQQKDRDGITFEYADETENMPDAKPCPAWIKCCIHRHGEQHAVEITEYLDECYQPPRGSGKFKGPWQTHTKRMLRHKALIQCARIAYGYAGIYDEDEAQRITQGEIQEAVIVDETTRGTEGVKEALTASAEPEAAAPDPDFRPINPDEYDALITLSGRKGLSVVDLMQLVEEKTGWNGDLGSLPLSDHTTVMKSLKGRRNAGAEGEPAAPTEAELADRQSDDEIPN